MHDEALIARTRTESAIKSERCQEALTIVIKFIARQHESRQVRTAETMQRLASLPTELRDLVMDFVISSQVFSYTVTYNRSLDDFADQFFTWPRARESVDSAASGNGEFIPVDLVDANMRGLLKASASRALLGNALIKMPAAFDLPPALKMPPTLASETDQQHIRHLVLALQTNVRKNTHHRELNRSIASMASMAALFPQLETCTFLCHFTFTHLEYQSARFSSFADFGTTNMLEARNIQTPQKMVTMEDTLLEFITAFHEHGPGKRKLVRFSHHARGSYFDSDVGPLVCVGAQSRLSNEKTEDIASELRGPHRYEVLEGDFMYDTVNSDAIAARVLTRAYNGWRTV